MPRWTGDCGRSRGCNPRSPGTCGTCGPRRIGGSRRRSTRWGRWRPGGWGTRTSGGLRRPLRTRPPRAPPRAETLSGDRRGMREEIRQYLIDRDVVSVPSEERARVIETPRFYRFATAAMNSPGSFERVAKEAFYYVTPVEDAWPPEKQEEWLRHLNYTSLRNISVHECYPGHYVHFLHRT